MITEDFLMKMVEISPYSVLLILAFFLFFHMHKTSINVIKEMQEKSIEEIQKVYNSAFVEMKKVTKK